MMSQRDMPKRRASRRGSQVSPSRKSMSQRETSTGQSTSPSRKRLSQIQTDAMSHIVACPQTKRSPNPVQHHVPEKSLIYAARMQFMKESPHASPQSSQTQIVYSVQRPQAFMTRAQKAKWRQVEAAKKKMHIRYYDTPPLFRKTAERIRLLRWF